MLLHTQIGNLSCASWQWLFHQGVCSSGPSITLYIACRLTSPRCCSECGTRVTSTKIGTQVHSKVLQLALSACLCTGRRDLRPQPTACTGICTLLLGLQASASSSQGWAI